MTLNNFDEAYANLTVVYFPSSYSLKEKPYYQEVVKELLKTAESAGASQTTSMP